MTYESERSTLLLIDAMKLRRAGLHGVVAAWAEPKNIEVLAAEPDSGVPEGLRTKCRMIVLSIGGGSMADPQVQGWIGGLRAAVPDAPLIVLSDREEQSEVVAAYRAGMRGFIPTSLEPAVALQAFTFIMSGGSFFPPAALLDSAQSRADEGSRAGESAAPSGTLTARQQDVLELLREGKSNKLIARELSMCESTVKVHVRQIMRKLGASNRTQAALSASAPQLGGWSASGRRADAGAASRGSGRSA